MQNFLRKSLLSSLNNVWEYNGKTIAIKIVRYLCDRNLVAR